jgi:translation elongation factor EF-1beta
MMAKTVKVTIQLVPESQDVDNDILGKEIIESLSCAWLFKVLSIEMGRSRKSTSGKRV